MSPYPLVLLEGSIEPMHNRVHLSREPATPEGHFRRCAAVGENPEPSQRMVRTMVQTICRQYLLLKAMALSISRGVAARPRAASGGRCSTGRCRSNVRARAASVQERKARADDPWSPDSWRKFPAQQQPDYEDEQELEAALETIRNSPPLVFAGECRNLQHELGEAALGRAFFLTGGDCAESFRDFSANGIRDSFRVLLQMAAVLMYGSGLPVVKMGRMAGMKACFDWLKRICCTSG